MESRGIQIGKYRMLYKFIEQTKEKDGVQMPHLERRIDCHPATPLNLVIENSIFEEELDAGKKQKVLTQFQNDTRNVPEHQKPQRILKFVNSIVQEDLIQGGKVYGLKVTYLNKDNDRFKYYY